MEKLDGKDQLDSYTLISPTWGINNHILFNWSSPSFLCKITPPSFPMELLNELIPLK